MEPEHRELASVVAGDRLLRRCSVWAIIGVDRERTIQHDGEEIAAPVALVCQDPDDDLDDLACFLDGSARILVSLAERCRTHAQKLKSGFPGIGPLPW